jgi:hypothetical protein
LHTVHPTDISKTQVVTTPYGLQIQPADCGDKLRQLRKQIEALEKELGDCALSDASCINEAKAKLDKILTDEATKDSPVAKIIRELQEHLEDLCTETGGPVLILDADLARTTLLLPPIPVFKRPSFAKHGAGYQSYQQSGALVFQDGQETNPAAQIALMAALLVIQKDPNLAAMVGLRPDVPDRAIVDGRRQISPEVSVNIGMAAEPARFMTMVFTPQDIDGKSSASLSMPELATRMIEVAKAAAFHGAMATKLAGTETGDASAKLAAQYKAVTKKNRDLVTFAQQHRSLATTHVFVSVRETDPEPYFIGAIARGTPSTVATPSE